MRGLMAGLIAMSGAFKGWKGSLNPDGDISAGLWTATPLWQKIDEEVASDADFVSSKDISTAGFSDIFEI